VPATSVDGKDVHSNDVAMITVWVAHQQCKNNNDDINGEQWLTAQQHMTMTVMTLMTNIGQQHSDNKTTSMTTSMNKTLTDGNDMAAAMTK